ncbi:S-adenosyl-L-methionine-dependent methyltransferase [Apodospora peruviana]|uniref:S-adenosyl-L-methionine-dependent methyltransferase n=1 Tax=Apodospora peruviana TaxID=516989 RepID=A0AAE0IDD2_9PEZI|nr:S-adenosyl-L-methionine-dependent methyltransferase [Apodospora peruviana]
MAALPAKQEIEALVSALNDVAKGYSDTPDLSGYVSRVQIIGKAKELVRAMITPDQTPNYHGLNMAELIAIRTFIKLKVLDAIPKTGSISLEDLSKATGAQDSLLERMGRVLVASGFLDQTRPDGGEYKHTKFSLAYLLDQPSPGHLFLAMYDEWFKHMHNYDDYLVARGQLEHAAEPDDPLRNPFTFYHKQDGTPVWGIMAQNPEKLLTFQKGMAGIDVAIPVVGHFDFGVLKNSPEENEQGVAELVDVGGGHGIVLKKILDTHPKLSPENLVLEDRPDVIGLARESGVLPAEVKLLEHDFTTEQPVKGKPDQHHQHMLKRSTANGTEIKTTGAKAYFMRMILHDYADHVGISILKQLAAAMSPASRVLICEMVLPSRVSELDFPAAVLDQAVMAMGGKERTEQGFRKMFEAAGIELVSVWRVPGVPGACVEGRLKRAE